jgi:uncharacterized membrane protein YdbT with pleckstrin-like domain
MMDKKHLPNPQPNEQVVIHVWPHPFIFVKIFIIYLVLFCIPIAAYFLIIWSLPLLLESETILPILTVICFSYYLVVLLLVLSIWMQTYLDVWTLTTRRIISRQQNGLFNRVVSELELYRVQDVTVEQKGFLPTILNYGDLYVQTAGKEERFVFKNIGEPIKVSRMIQRLDEDVKRSYINQSI